MKINRFCSRISISFQIVNFKVEIVYRKFENIRFEKSISNYPT